MGSPRIRVSPKEQRTVDGITFDSKAEARRYGELKLLQERGIVAWFLRQPRFDLPGGTRYTADFLVYWKRPEYAPDASLLYDEDRVGIEDVKGHRTAAYIRAKKQVEALYPIRITEVRR